MRQLTEIEYFRLVFLHAKKDEAEAGREGMLCNHEPLFNRAAFAVAESRLGPNSSFTEELVSFGSGFNRLRVLWFRTHETRKGRAVGPLALVRTTEDFAQVFALGAFEGVAETSRFGVERVGDEIILTAVDDGCGASKSGEPCDSTLHLFKVELGRLEEIAQLAVERVRRSSQVEDTPAYADSESVTHRLEATPSYEGTNVRVLEQITTLLAGGKELSSTERERVMSFYGDRVQWSEPPLWDRVYQ